MNKIVPLPVHSENADAVGYVCTRPEEGRAQLDILIKLGCKPHHRVLEIGCGALVAGFQIMQYLDPGNYTGIEPNTWLVMSSLKIVDVADVIAVKKPSFCDRSDFRACADVKFDFIISHSILSHTSDTQLTEFLVAAKDQLVDDGVLTASIRLAEGNEFGSPGSALHGADFAEWQYPGVSWFKEADVLDRARQVGLPVFVAPELTRTILRGNPKAIHDWICTKQTGVTFVSAFFRLRDRTVDEGELFRRFDELAASGLLIVLFLDSRLVDRAPKRQNVRVVPIKLEELWPFNLDQEFRLPTNRTVDKDTRDFLLMQNAKLELLEKATIYTPSAHFAWIDFGIMKIVRRPRQFLKKLRLLSPPPHGIMAPGCWTREQSDQSDPESVNWRFCGGFLVADRESVFGLATRNRLMVSRPELTWEVNLWAELERFGNVTFDWYKADHDDSIVCGDELDDSDANVPRTCLTMIVKNEARVIERCLESALPYIDTWCITDTGSSDDTATLIERFFERHGIPGKIVHGEFKNYSQARNDSLRNALDAPDWEYAILIDADMKLTGTLDKSALSAPAYKIIQKNGSLDYMNTRLVRRDSGAHYVGVTHEYLAVEGVETLSSLVIDDCDDGGNKPEKLDRDIRLLTDGLITEPDNGRYMFYLAQTYRGVGRSAESIPWYRRRIESGGWAEEVWASYYGMAQAYRDVDDEANFVKTCLDAHEFRPSRGESLKILARYYRDKGRNDAAVLAAEALAKIRYPSDELFVERDVYDFGADQELAIAGFYSKLPSRRAAGYDACARLTLHPYDGVREEAHKNFTFYVKAASALFGAEVRAIDWAPEDGWAPMNPSVCVGPKEKRLVLVRTVNYVVADGQYPTIDNSGIIRTRNYILELDENWKTLKSTLIRDVTGMSRNSFPVEGYEDCRLWRSPTSYFASATVRDLADNPGGHCEMAIVNFDEQWRLDDTCVVRDYEHGRTQKNWMPIEGLPGSFLYLCDPTIVIEVSNTGRTVEIARHEAPACLVDLRGGSQLIPYYDGWLCLTHEVVWRPGRVYLHRFVQFDREFRIVAVSDLFYFAHIGIEFCAGLAHDGGRLVASFGVNDASAHLAFFDTEAVNRALCPL